MPLIDVVNFNSDASCLATADWLRMLEGGESSLFHRWLRLYSDPGHRVVLGIPGATAADIAAHNPESVALIRDRPDVFQLIHRPYSHDLALVRTPAGFRRNLTLGRQVLEGMFGRLAPFFLPPEFMCTSDQARVLAEHALATFVYSARLDPHVADELPARPFPVIGTGGSRLPCVPFRSNLTPAYLKTVQLIEPSHWRAATADPAETLYLWRDGESAFLLPDTLHREAFWLDTTRPTQRAFLDRAAVDRDATGPTHAYPLPSFSAWVREMKMYWFIEQLREVELGLDAASPLESDLWMHAINSDILSSVEKRPPRVMLAPASGSGGLREFVIARHSRALEGEDYLLALRQIREGMLPDFLRESAAPHLVKLRARLAILDGLRGKAAAR